MPEKLEVKKGSNDRVQFHLRDLPGRIVITHAYVEEIAQALERGFKDEVSLVPDAYRLVVDMARKCDEKGRTLRVFYDVRNKFQGIGFRWSSDKNSGVTTRNLWVDPEGNLGGYEISSSSASIHETRPTPELFTQCFSQFISDIKHAHGEGAGRASQIHI